MDYTKLFDTIESLYSQYIDVWVDVCNIESPTSCKTGVDAVGNYFADLAKGKGWSVDGRAEKDAGDVVCITMNDNVAAEPIIFSAHMDTVHPIGSFGYPPVRIEDAKIYGPGVCDCKGGAVAAFLAMDALWRCGFDRRPVMLLLQSDEENGSRQSGKDTINYMCERSRGAIAFLNLEGETAGRACIQRKGIATFTFTVRGVEAHASKCADTGASAIAEAAYKILEIEKIKDPDGVTCNCGVIRGGSVSNTVPSFCSFTVDTRFATREQYDWIRGEMERIAKEIHVEGCTCVFEQISGRPPMEICDRNIDLLEKMNRIYASCGMPTLTPIMRGGGSDAADITVSGTPCVDSLGVNGNYIHSPREYAKLDSLKSAAKRVAAIAWGI